MIKEDSVHQNGSTPSYPALCFEERFFSLYSFQEEGWLCDVTIMCVDGSVPAHKVILAATSSYFKHMFSSEMRESKSDEVRMSDMTCETIRCILKYLYTTELDVNSDNALEVLRAANLLCLESLEKECCVVLLGPMSEKSAVEYALLTEQYGMTSLLDSSVGYLVKHCKYLMNNGLCDQLGLQAFQKLVESDHLDVKDEQEVFKMVLRWVEYDNKSRSPHFRSLLEHVRLPLLPPLYLVDIVEKSQYVRTDLHCRDLVDEAKNRHLLPMRTQGYLSERMTPRKSTVGYIFLIGGLSVKERSLLCSVERYDLPLQQTFKMPDMGLARSGLGCAIIDKVLYVIGGHDGAKCLKIGECMDFGKGIWTWVPQLQVPRRNLGLCADDTRLYAVGGQVNSNTTLDSLETYDRREGLWQSQEATMSCARKYANVCYLDNNLYVVGGNDGTQYLHSCERYDLRAAKWDSVASLPRPFGANGLVVWNECLAAVGGFDSRQCLDLVHLYSPSSDTWSALSSPMSYRRTGLGAVAAGNRLYALGGHSGEAYLDTVEMYDNDTSSWQQLRSLGCKRGAMGIAVLENCYMTNPS